MGHFLFLWSPLIAIRRFSHLLCRGYFFAFCFVTIKDNKSKHCCAYFTKKLHIFIAGWLNLVEDCRSYNSSSLQPSRCTYLHLYCDIYFIIIIWISEVWMWSVFNQMKPTGAKYSATSNIISQLRSLCPSMFTLWAGFGLRAILDLYTISLYICYRTQRWTAAHFTRFLNRLLQLYWLSSFDLHDQHHIIFSNWSHHKERKKSAFDHCSFTPMFKFVLFYQVT